MIQRVFLFALMLTLSAPVFAQEKTKGQRTVPEIAKQTTKMERQGLNPQPEPPASQANIMSTTTAPSVTSIPQKTLLKIDRPVLRIQSFQNVQLSGDNYQWNATIVNTCSETINNILMIASKKVNGTWIPAGADVTIASITPNASRTLNGSWTSTNATDFKLDLMAKLDNTQPYKLQDSKTSAFTPGQGANLADNLTITNLSLTPQANGNLQWTATFNNNNNVTITQNLHFGLKQLVNNQWKDTGESGGNNFPAHASSTIIGQFIRHPLATQFKVSCRNSSYETLTESTVTTLAAETISLNISNLSVSKQGTMANWSATITNASTIAAAKIKVSTFHRAQGGSWITASNTQDLGQAAAGAAKQASGVFTSGGSTQFKIVAEYQTGTFVGVPVYSQTFESETTF